MQSSGYVVLYIVLALIALVVLLYILKLRKEAKKSADSHGMFEVVSNKEISQIFETALDFNSRFDLRFKGQSREFFCTFKNFDRNSIYLEPPAQINISKNWEGRDLSVFFKVKPGSGKLRFYKFISKITEVTQEEIGRVLKLKMPEMLEMEQKRQHLRLEVPTGYVKRFEIRPVSYDSKGSLHRQIGSFGEPFWIMDEDLRKSEISLMDMSGGGLRFKVLSRALKKVDEFVAKNPSLLISLQLVHDFESESEVENHNVVARIKKHYNDGLGNYVFGVQYVSKAVLNEEKKVITGWEQVDVEEGIEELVTWVIKMHLKLYREKGLV
ncbi:MAG: hypothetical protein ABR533_03070 [Desulfonatronovibrio sp.]